MFILCNIRKFFLFLLNIILSALFWIQCSCAFSIWYNLFYKFCTFSPDFNIMPPTLVFTFCTITSDYHFSVFLFRFIPNLFNFFSNIQYKYCCMHNMYYSRKYIYINVTILSILVANLRFVLFSSWIIIQLIERIIIALQNICARTILFFIQLIIDKLIFEINTSFNMFICETHTYTHTRFHCWLHVM